MPEKNQAEVLIKDQDRLQTAQIGRCGELLVQYRLLKHGIESAPMTTDTGIDLVAYAPRMSRPITMQVKTKNQPTPGGGKGRMSLDWWLRESSPAEIVALADLKTERVWLFLHHELDKCAQQRSNGKLHFYFSVEPEHMPRTPGRHDREYEDYLLEARVNELFGRGEL